MTNKVIKDKKELIKLVSFLAMTNGQLNITKRKDRSNSNASFIMNIPKINEDFLLYVKSILENITSVSVKDNTDDYNDQALYRLETARHPTFTTIRDRIYTFNYKGLDPHYLKLLDWEALSILYMCEGDKHNSDIILNLKRLSYGDQFILKKEIKGRLELEWNIHRTENYYHLVLRDKDKDKFIENINPFILPSFQYKLK